MLPQERQKQILTRLQSRGQVLVQDLVRELTVSEDTIRRDLKDLAQSGLLKKVHGGAVLLSSVPYSHRERLSLNREAKRKLANIAAELVQSNMLIFVDGATTTLELPAALEDLPLSKITFVTHSPVMAQRLSELGFAEIILLGGKLIKDLLITAGLDSIKQAEQFRPDLSIISAHGISVPAGATVESWEDALVIAGQEKLGYEASHMVLPTEKISYIVTDASTSECLGFQNKGVTVLHQVRPT
ncbi:MAG: HTH-type transcriptional repressor GlcR [bacterium ADurb.Bin425]|nr:MAG: HTH-type transcriptional repressor GlcR [bacterium ADurb.Bin425]